MQLVEFAAREGLQACTRYDLLERVRRLADRRGLRFLAFDVRREVRLLLEGPEASLRGLARALKAGTVQAEDARGRRLHLGVTLLRPVVDPLEALVDLHGADGDDPLETPWTSHRDLMGFRAASFFDGSVWSGRIDPRLVHIRCGGGDLPGPRPEPVRTDLDLPLRVSAAVLGVLPADPSSFRLFSHLARWSGARQVDIARALVLTPRRIRQLQAQPEPRLAVAARVLTDRRLSRVP